MSAATPGPSAPRAIGAASLTCGSCRGETLLSAEPVVRRAEIITFCDAHNGHGDRLSYIAELSALPVAHLQPDSA
jgi:hypothetical protein